MNDLLIAGKTDVGQRRKDNQDTFICTPLWSEASALLVVIDGVGGYAGGDRAAAIAKESIERYMATPNGDPLSMLREAVVFANNQINEERLKERRLGQMCCVLTAALADSHTGKLYFVHVGDTRLYRYRQGNLVKLTRDHSMVGVREDANELTEAEAMSHPRRNEILREVGSTTHRVDDPDFLESDETDFLPGDQLLLCSDGLTDMITQAQIKAILNRAIPVEEQLLELIRVANHQGGNDNITVVLARNTANSTNASVVEPLVTTTPSLAQNTSAAPVSPSAQPQPAATPAKRSSTGRWVALFALLAILVAGIVWYQSWPSGNTHATSDSLRATGAPSGDTTFLLSTSRSRIDSLIEVATRSSDHRLLLTDDTIRISQPLLLTDSLLAVIGSSPQTVIMPLDSTHDQLAMRVDRRGAVTLENVVVSGFKTGIETTGETKLQLNRVYFSQVDLPVRATVRQDTCLNTVISVSVQKQPVAPKQPTAPKPIRP
ncbi:PP2C family protein-serine/threonine phosphatase [Spirosoma radiotolerans]|uniref:Serine/threonine protein phosphatase n=1 Tax=Spirosoma radiotolerans TaxID=1379870 RepID=A0A0E3ZXM8_9BACT|nr:protein phosphatase 2C domain-containing protein [Spirosoma radiotolerans]AKD56308.1 serine/threonine protein phosphatase [Spirosoma radiotolerans]